MEYLRGDILRLCGAVDGVGETVCDLGVVEGEEEIENHGWSRVKSFSQETEARGQQTPRIGAHRLKLKSLKRRMRADSQTQLPNFSSQAGVSGADHVSH